MSMMLRRQMMRGTKEHIGYITGQGLNSNGGIVYNENLFMTNDIPVNFGGVETVVTVRWADSGALRELVGDNSVCTLYAKSENGSKVDYWAGNTETGEREITIAYTEAENPKKIVLIGYLPDIRNCYLKDETNNVILWKYGM